MSQATSIVAQMTQAQIDQAKTRIKESADKRKAAREKSKRHHIWIIRYLTIVFIVFILFVGFAVYRGVLLFSNIKLPSDVLNLIAQYWWIPAGIAVLLLVIILVKVFRKKGKSDTKDKKKSSGMDLTVLKNSTNIVMPLVMVIVAILAIKYLVGSSKSSASNGTGKGTPSTANVSPLKQFIDFKRMTLIEGGKYYFPRDVRYYVQLASPTDASAILYCQKEGDPNVNWELHLTGTSATQRNKRDDGSWGEFYFIPSRTVDVVFSKE